MTGTYDGEGGGARIQLCAALMGLLAHQPLAMITRWRRLHARIARFATINMRWLIRTGCNITGGIRPETGSLHRRCEGLGTRARRCWMLAADAGLQFSICGSVALTARELNRRQRSRYPACSR